MILHDPRPILLSEYISHVANPFTVILPGAASGTRISFGPTLPTGTKLPLQLLPARRASPWTQWNRRQLNGRITQLARPGKLAVLDNPYLRVENRPGIGQRFVSNFVRDTGLIQRTPDRTDFSDIIRGV
jgi:hypothetical protein